MMRISFACCVVVREMRGLGSCGLLGLVGWRSGLLIEKDSLPVPASRTVVRCHAACKKSSLPPSSPITAAAKLLKAASVFCTANHASRHASMSRPVATMADRQ